MSEEGDRRRTATGAGWHWDSCPRPVLLMVLYNNCEALLLNRPPPLTPGCCLRSCSHDSLPFSRERWILSRVFLMRRAVSLAEGFWYQHSFINLTRAERVCQRDHHRQRERVKLWCEDNQTTAVLTWRIRTDHSLLCFLIIIFNFALPADGLLNNFIISFSNISIHFYWAPEKHVMWLQNWIKSQWNRDRFLFGQMIVIN